jgi:glucose/arabinose dehydrogenase
MEKKHLVGVNTRVHQYTKRLLLQLGVIGSIGLSASVQAQIAAPASPVQKTEGVTTTVLAEGLSQPWGMAFLPGDAGILITEKPGQLRLWHPTRGLSAPIEGVPKVYSRSQGGLLDVILAPDFEKSRQIYFAYAEAGEDGKAGTVVSTARLSDDTKRLENVKVIVRQTPKLSTGNHFGARLVFDREGYLFVAFGENNQRSASQDLSGMQGKVLRLNADGSVPKDNPFAGKAGARAEIWSYGHRNPQGAALNPVTGALWVNEHGPRGGDELNIPKAGKNYGWPLATYGVNYSTLPIPEAKGTHVDGTEQPDYYWAVSPAISGMAFYTDNRFPSWKNSVFIGALGDKSLIRLTLNGDKVTGEERLLSKLGERIRDVRAGPDGYIYVLTDAANGKLVRVGLAQ